MDPFYLLGRGEASYAERDADGNPGDLQDFGEAPEIEISVDVEYAENFNTKKAISRKDLKVAKSQTAKIRLVLKEHTVSNLALAFFGEVVEHAGGNFAGVAFPSGVVAGETRLVPGNRTKLSAVSIVDSAGSPDTLEEGVDYEVDLVYGTVKFLNVTGFTQPFKITGTEAASKSVALLKKRAQVVYLYLKGINIAGDEDKPFAAGLYRVQLGPAQKLAAKSDDVAMLEFEGELLSDDEKGDDAALGTYGYYRDLS
jgi:hypothetical protein